MADFLWHGKVLKNMGDVLQAAEKCQSREEAQDFMTAYRAITPHADVNIGYGSGYFDAPTMRRIQEWCGVKHPMFGTDVPTPTTAFERGKLLGQAMRDSN